MSKKSKAGSKKPKKKETKETKENQDINLEKYIKALKLEDIGSWTKESQEAYVRARLKARQKQTKLDSCDLILC